MLIPSQRCVIFQLIQKVVFNHRVTCQVRNIVPETSLIFRVQVASLINEKDLKPYFHYSTRVCMYVSQIACHVYFFY